MANRLHGDHYEQRGIQSIIGLASTSAARLNMTGFYAAKKKTSYVFFYNTRNL